MQTHQPQRDWKRIVAAVTLALGISITAYSQSAHAAGRSPSAARPAQSANGAQVFSDVQIIGAEPNSETILSIQKTVNSLVAASNSHNLEEVLKHYASRFTSGDNLSLFEVKRLIMETWQTFPDIQYKSRLMEIRVSGDWATVESVDTATATAKVDPIISEKPGQLNSRSRGLLYLHRTRDGWDVMSDYTLFEMATITYGTLEPLEYALSAPEQTFAGENYSAKLNLKIPKGLLAIATISQEPLVYPQIKPKDRFRSMAMDRESLERIFQANSTNNNEIVTATVGLTQIGQDDEDRPTIRLGGLVTIVKRVNVIPKSVFKNTAGKDDLVKTSADGKLDYTKASDADVAPTSGSPVENAPPDIAPEASPQPTVPEEVPNNPGASPAPSTQE